jgi:hypothetical protein
MARVTADEVKAIASDDLPSDAVLSVFIDIATAMVDDRLAEKSLTDTVLKILEMYLSAHFAVLKYKYNISSKIGPSSDSFANQVDLGLNQTVYGQQAVVLDSSGTLAALNQQASKASQPFFMEVF